MISWLVASTNHGATRLTLFGGQGISGVSRGHFCILPWRSHWLFTVISRNADDEARLCCYGDRIQSSRLSTRTPKADYQSRLRHSISSQGHHPISQVVCEPLSPWVGCVTCMTFARLPSRRIRCNLPSCLLPGIEKHYCTSKARMRNGKASKQAMCRWAWAQGRAYVTNMLKGNSHRLLDRSTTLKLAWRGD